MKKAENVQDQKKKMKVLDEILLDGIIAEYRDNRQRIHQVKQERKEKGKIFPLKENSFQSQSFSIDFNTFIEFLSSQLKNPGEIIENSGDLVIREGIDVTRISKNGQVSSTSKRRYGLYQRIVRDYKRTS